VPPARSAGASAELDGAVIFVGFDLAEQPERHHHRVTPTSPLVTLNLA